MSVPVIGRNLTLINNNADVGLYLESAIPAVEKNLTYFLGVVESQRYKR